VPTIDTTSGTNLRRREADVTIQACSPAPPFPEGARTLRSRYGSAERPSEVGGEISDLRGLRSIWTGLLSKQCHARHRRPRPRRFTRSIGLIVVEAAHSGQDRGAITTIVLFRDSWL